MAIGRGGESDCWRGSVRRAGGVRLVWEGEGVVRRVIVDLLLAMLCSGVGWRTMDGREETTGSLSDKNDLESMKRD